MLDITDRSGSSPDLVLSGDINDPTLADAIMDRLSANASRIELKGESRRIKIAQLLIPLRIFITEKFLFLLARKRAADDRLTTLGQHAGMMGQHKQEWWVNMDRNLQITASRTQMQHTSSFIVATLILPVKLS